MTVRLHFCSLMFLQHTTANAHSKGESSTIYSVTITQKLYTAVIQKLQNTVIQNTNNLNSIRELITFDKKTSCDEINESVLMCLCKRNNGARMDGILEVDEACKYLKMAKVTLYRHVRNGVIPAFKVGGAWKFNKSSLDEWIQQRVKEDTAARSLKSTAKSKAAITPSKPTSKKSDTPIKKEDK